MKKEIREEKIKKIILVVLMIILMIAIGNIIISGEGNKGSNQQQIETSQQQIRVKEESLTQSIQTVLDKTFKGTNLRYRAEAEIGSIESYGIVGWFNIYPLNAQSWDLLPTSQKKDFAAILINISRADINKDLGLVYIKNEVRVLAKGYWDTLKGNVIEIK